MRSAVLLVASLLVLTGCETMPKEADAFVAYEAGFPSQKHPVQVALLYLPNRIVDMLDIIHFGFEFNLGAGIEFHFTRYGRLGAIGEMAVGEAWLGRFTYPSELTAYWRLSASLNQADGSTSKENPPWRFPKWDCGLYVMGVYVAFCPDEFIDFILGWSTFDSKGDDW